MRTALKDSLAHLSSLVMFLRAPVLLHRERDVPFRTTFLYGCIGLIFAVATAGISSALVYAGLLPDPGKHALDDLSPLIVFFGAVILAPLLEELLFRMQLKSFNGNLIFTMLTAAVVLIHFLPDGPLPAGGCLVTMSVIYLLIRAWSGKSISRKFTFWRYLFPVNFYLTALTFSFLHLYNFSRAESLIYIGLLYTVPQLILGLVLGYVRIRYDLKQAMLLHAFYNGTFFLLMFTEDLISKV